MEEWQIRQKHWDDIKAVHSKLGNLDGQGRVRKFNGQTFFPEIEKLGHSAGALESCKCWLGKTGTIQY